MSTTLERYKLIILTYLDEKLFDSVEGRRTIQMAQHLDFDTDVMALRITQEIYGERLGTLELINTPTTWLQMLKEQYAPLWFLRLSPVKYTKVTYEARVLYPKIAFPALEHNYVWGEKDE